MFSSTDLQPPLRARVATARRAGKCEREIPVNNESSVNRWLFLSRQIFICHKICKDREAENKSAWLKRTEAVEEDALSVGYGCVWVTGHQQAAFPLHVLGAGYEIPSRSKRCSAHSHSFPSLWSGGCLPRELKWIKSGAEGHKTLMVSKVNCNKDI